MWNTIFTNATLTGVTTGGITGNPTLPPGWTLVDGSFVFPR